MTNHTCIFCGEVCSWMGPLKAHSSTCPEHPAVKRAAELEAAAKDALAFVNYALEFWDWSIFQHSEEAAERLRDRLAALTTEAK